LEQRRAGTAHLKQQAARKHFALAHPVLVCAVTSVHLKSAVCTGGAHARAHAREEVWDACVLCGRALHVWGQKELAHARNTLAIHASGHCMHCAHA